MRIAVFSAQPYDAPFLEAANAAHAHHLTFLQPALGADTLALLPEGSDAVCVFVNDRVDAGVLAGLAARGVRAVALRCAGFDNVDLTAARQQGIRVMRVPAYSPESVAEHALALMMGLLRHVPRAHARASVSNFSLQGLMGRRLHGATVGLIGTGRIGHALARCLVGCGCEVVAVDPEPSDDCAALGVRYLTLDEVLPQADILSLHCPLTDETRHLLDASRLAMTRPGVLVVNTSRGGVVDTRALIAALKSGQVGGAGLDVYEGERGLFFADHSNAVLADDDYARLQGMPNVILTAHQAFFTHEAMAEIAAVTLDNLSRIERGEACQCALC